VVQVNADDGAYLIGTQPN